MQIKVIYSLIDNMVNFKDKNMPAVIDKALDFIGAMDVSAPTPSSMNESTAKGIFKYLKELGHKKALCIADNFICMESGERIVIKNPEYFSTYMQEELKALVWVKFISA